MSALALPNDLVRSCSELTLAVHTTNLFALQIWSVGSKPPFAAVGTSDRCADQADYRGMAEPQVLLARTSCSHAAGTVSKSRYFRRCAGK